MPSVTCQPMTVRAAMTGLPVISGSGRIRRLRDLAGATAGSSFRERDPADLTSTGPRSLDSMVGPVPTINPWAR